MNHAFRLSACWVLLLIVLACGGGGMTPSSSLSGPWVTVSPPMSGATVTLSNEETLVLSYSGGTVTEHADAFRDQLISQGWAVRFDQGNDSDGRTMMFEHQGSSLAVSVLDSGNATMGILLSASLTGTLPSGAEASKPAVSRSAPAASEKPAPEAKPSAKPKPKRDCHDDVWYPCDQACGDVGWSCKTSCDNSVTGPCADACAEAEYACKTGCNEKKWACEG